MTLNFGDEKVTKLYYGDKDVSGNQMLEAGTIVYRGEPSTTIHLLSVDSQWDNISKLRITAYNKSINGNDTLGKIALTVDRSLIELKESYTTTTIDYYDFTVVESEANGDKVLSVTASSPNIGTIEVMVL